MTLLLQGQDLAKGYLATKTTLRAYFPSLTHLSKNPEELYIGQVWAWYG